MSVIVTMRVQGDTEQFRRYLETGADQLRAIRDAAQSQGCIHHRFGVAEDYVLVVDEWESAEAFQRFMDRNEQLQQVMRDAGARSAPEATLGEAVSSPDQF